MGLLEQLAMSAQKAHVQSQQQSWAKDVVVNERTETIKPARKTRVMNILES